MFYQEMIKKTQADLGISYFRSRKLIESFSRIYKGYKEAISNTKASYTDDGDIQITYTINNKENVVVLPTRKESASKRNRKKKIQNI